MLLKRLILIFKLTSQSIKSLKSYRSSDYVFMLCHMSELFGLSLSPFDPQHPVTFLVWDFIAISSSPIKRPSYICKCLLHHVLSHLTVLILETRNETSLAYVAIIYFFRHVFVFEYWMRNVVQDVFKKWSLTELLVDRNLNCKLS